MKRTVQILAGLGLALVLALIFTPAPRAADPTPTVYYETTGTLTLVTNSVPASVTLTNSASQGIIPCGSAENIAVMLRSRNTNAIDAATLTLKFSRSIDGTIFETTPGITWGSPTLATTATNYTATNISAPGWRYFKLETIANGSTGTVNSLEVTYGAKRTQVRQ
jgi:hypothetical protein